MPMCMRCLCGWQQIVPQIVGCGGVDVSAHCAFLPARTQETGIQRYGMSRGKHKMGLCRNSALRLSPGGKLEKYVSKVP